MASSTGQRLWSITCFFNPTGSCRRLANYHAFRQQLVTPLVTAELAYGTQPELHEGDADILLHFQGHDVLWQKERLLNLALKAVPPVCDSIAWLDCDVIFERDDWPALVRRQLEHCMLVQPFQNVFDLDANLRREEVDLTCPKRQSLACKVASGSLSPELLATARLRNEWGCAAGLAWAGRRDLLERHGFYDAGIVGGGDRSMVCAAYGCWQGLERTHQLNESQQRHYLAWANPFSQSVQAQVGFVPGGISHLWHGNVQKRGYGTRFEGLAPFAFDPAPDIALDEQGCWRWNSNKTDLHRYVWSYFDMRNDDG